MVFYPKELNWILQITCTHLGHVLRASCVNLCIWFVSVQPVDNGRWMPRSGLTMSYFYTMGFNQ